MPLARFLTVKSTMIKRVTMMRKASALTMITVLEVGSLGLTSGGIGGPSLDSAEMIKHKFYTCVKKTSLFDATETISEALIGFSFQ